MMKVTIMRGLPGSGKSTYVADNLMPAILCSADKFHYDAEGKYKYHPANAGLAHAQCLDDFHKALRGTFPYIVVDNTNTTLAELTPYVRWCEAIQVEFEIILIWCDPAVAFKRNVHGVPFQTILRMYNNLLTETLPSNWKQRVIV